MPFGVALLAENLSTHNMKWGVFYFGICLFGQYWTGFIQRFVLTIFKGDTTITWTEDFFLTDMPKEDQNRALLIFLGFPGALGVVLVSICLLSPWIALAGYTVYIFTSLNPVKSLNSLLPTFAKLLK